MPATNDTMAAAGIAPATGIAVRRRARARVARRAVAIGAGNFLIIDERLVF